MTAAGDGWRRSALYAVLVVAAISLVGAVVSVQADLNETYLDALGPHGYPSVPLPMTAFQLPTALSRGSDRGSSPWPAPRSSRRP